MAWNRESGCPTWYYAIVVVRNPLTDTWLAVEETRNRGWWLPGGFVECGDSVTETAHKETLEEAGIEIRLHGVLRVEQRISSERARERVVFYAEPVNPEQRPKSVADKESQGAKWVSEKELIDLYRKGKLRGPELLLWAQHIKRGGMIYPLSVFSKSEAAPPDRQFRHTVTKQVFDASIHFQSEMANSKPNELKGLEKSLKWFTDNSPALVRTFLNQRTNHKQWTLLMFACSIRRSDLVEWLLERSVDVNAATHKGRTALHIAVQHSPLIAGTLLKHGASMFTIDQNGQTPFHWACAEALVVLREHDPQMAKLAMQVKDKRGNRVVEENET